MRKQFYDKCDVPKPQETYRDVSPLFLGSALHAELERRAQAYSESSILERKMAYDIRQDKAVAPMDIETYTKPEQLLVGSLDAVHTLPDGRTVLVDYKTRNGRFEMMGDQANMWHQTQVSIYRMMWMAYGLDAPDLVAVAYWDTSNAVKRMQAFIVEPTAVEDVKAYLNEVLDVCMESAKTRQLPERNKAEDWYCNGHCPYRKRCDGEEHIPEDVPVGVDSVCLLILGMCIGQLYHIGMLYGA